MTKFKPKRYFVYVTATMKGLEPYTARVGKTDDPKQIRRIIADNEKAMKQTFGGLIDPGPVFKRTYCAFRAEWSEVTLDGEG